MPSRIKLRPRSTPPTPGPDSETLFLDEADGVLKSIDSEGVVTAVEGEGGGAAEPGTLVEKLTGTQTEYGHLYRGDEDPEVDFGAELEAGDLWIDTNVTAGYQFVRKVRNLTNDGWDFDAIVVTDGTGLVLAFLTLDPDGSLYYGGPGVGVNVLADGSVEVNHVVTNAAIKITTAGGIEISGALLGTGTVLVNENGDVVVGNGQGGVNVDPTGNVLLNGPSLQFGNVPVGTQADAVDDVVGADPADIAATLNELLAALRASNELAT